MLKERMITAATLVPLTLLPIVWFSPETFALCITLVIALAAWEWSNLASLRGMAGRLIYVLSVVLLCWLVKDAPVILVLSVSLVWWFFALLLVWGYPATVRFVSRRPVRLLMGTLTLVPTWYGMLKLKEFESSGKAIILVFLLIWSADIGAYFVGKNFGSRKLARHVSPNKTVEGLFGGVCTSVIFALLVGFFWDISFQSGLVFLLLTMAVVLVSVLGDLFESMLKRERGIKDSSHLLPGHGGLLDRIDSLTAAIPVFTLLVVLSGWGH